MKHPSLPIITVAIAIALPTNFLLAQDTTTVQTSAYRASIAQDEVRLQTERVKLELLAILEDIEQNQLAGAELEQAKSTFAKLANISESQIEPIIQKLRDAATIDSSGTVEKQLVDASVGQKEVQRQLRILADELALRHDQATMERRLRQLLQRQAANLRQTEQLASNGNIPKELSSYVGLSTNEQNSLKNEITLTLQALARVAAGLKTEEGKPFAEAFQVSNDRQLAPNAATASDLTSQQKFAQAALSQHGVLDTVAAMLAKLRKDVPLKERLGELAEQASELAKKQAELKEETSKSSEAKQPALREEQRKLGQQTAALEAEMEALNVKASTQLDQANSSMNKAEMGLAQNKGMKPEQKAQVESAQETAKQQLANAGAELKAQSDALPSAPQTAAQEYGQLAQVNEQIQSALARQNALNSAPASPANAGEQMQIAQQAAAMQQQLAPLNEDAAAAMGQAASEAVEAAQSAKNPAEAAQSAQAASQALAQAASAVQQELQATAQAAAQQQAMQAMANQLNTARSEAAAAGSQMQPGASDMTNAARQTEAAQQALQQAQSQAPGAGAPPEAAQAMSEAQKALGDSRLQAAQGNQAAAAAGNSQAQKAMASAQTAISKAMAAAASGSPSPSGSPSQSPSQAGQPGQPAQPGQSGIAQNGMSGGGMDGGMGNFLNNNGKAGGTAQVVSGLKPKEREAITSLQREKTPDEYRTATQQYLKNLANGEAPGF